MQIFVIRVLLGIVSIPFLYVIVAMILSITPVNSKQDDKTKSKYIYLNSNGVHLDIVLDKSELSNNFLTGVKIKETDQFVSIGWGDRDFYINTPTWGDLTFKVAFKAMFLKSSTLMHVTKYQTMQPTWIKVPVSDLQMKALKQYIKSSFLFVNGSTIQLDGHSYGREDEFYEAKGSYSLFKTCNTWANSALKKSGLKAAYWTPLDLSLIHI